MPSLLRLDLQAVQAGAHHLDQVTTDLTLERSVRNWVDLSRIARPTFMQRSVLCLAAALDWIKN